MYIIQMKKPFVVRIDGSSQVPAYQQIVAEIRALLVLDELLPGTALPTVRQLAVDLNVHHNTVAQAYRVLAQEGWLDLRRGRGAQVIRRSKALKPNPSAHRTFQSRLKRLLAKAVAEGVAPNLIKYQLTLHAREVEAWNSAKGE